MCIFYFNFREVHPDFMVFELFIHSVTLKLESDGCLTKRLKLISDYLKIF